MSNGILYINCLTFKDQGWFCFSKMFFSIWFHIKPFPLYFCDGTALQWQRRQLWNFFPGALIRWHLAVSNLNLLCFRLLICSAFYCWRQFCEWNLTTIGALMTLRITTRKCARPLEQLALIGLETIDLRHVCAVTSWIRLWILVRATLTATSTGGSMYPQTLP